MALRKNPKFDLKKNYHRIFEIGIIISLLFVISAFKFMPKYDKIISEEIQLDEFFVVHEDIIRTNQEKPEVPQKPAAPVISINTEDLIDIELEATEIDISENIAKPKESAPKESKIVEESDADYKFIPLENPPAPIGGIQSIMKKIKYPEIARKAEIQGQVVIAASVNEKGDVVKAEIVKGIGGGCDEEAIKAILATKFSPGLQRGKPIKVKVSIPVVFRLN